jgi:hypothetical protein
MKKAAELWRRRAEIAEETLSMLVRDNPATIQYVDEVEGLVSYPLDEYANLAYAMAEDRIDD